MKIPEVFVEYGTLLTFLLFAMVFVAGGLIVNQLLMPHRPTEEKETTYECGIDPVGDAHIRYNIRFYVFALMYVIFAVEAAFLIPWAVVYKRLAEYGWFPFIEVLIFLFILILGLAYAWNKGELKWD